MPIRPLAPFDVNGITSVDDALAMLDAGLADLMEMSSDQAKFGPKEIWTFDKNVLSLKSRYDKAIELIRKERQP